MTQAQLPHGVFAELDSCIRSQPGFSHELVRNLPPPSSPLSLPLLFLLSAVLRPCSDAHVRQYEESLADSEAPEVWSIVMSPMHELARRQAEAQLKSEGNKDKKKKDKDEKKGDKEKGEKGEGKGKGKGEKKEKDEEKEKKEKGKEKEKEKEKGKEKKEEEEKKGKSGQEKKQPGAKAPKAADKGKEPKPEAKKDKAKKGNSVSKPKPAAGKAKKPAAGAPPHRLMPLLVSRSLARQTLPPMPAPPLLSENRAAPFCFATTSTTTPC